MKHKSNTKGSQNPKQQGTNIWEKLVESSYKYAIIQWVNVDLIIFFKMNKQKINCFYIYISRDKPTQKHHDTWDKPINKLSILVPPCISIRKPTCKQMKKDLPVIASRF